MSESKPCMCNIVFDGEAWSILYCPLHEAAPNVLDRIEQLECENARLRAQRDKLLEACEVAYKFARGKHSTFTYWPKNICGQLEAAIKAAKERL